MTTVTRDIDLILSIAADGLEKQLQQADPSLGATGHLYYVLEALAECLLTPQQQALMQVIVMQHQTCMYISR